MFRSFGHNNSSVINGGLPAWAAAGLEVQQKKEPLAEPSKTTYPEPTLLEGVVKGVLVSLYTRNSQVGI